ncbi:hypothetical protein D7U87_15525 [Stenotrophomonas maltophilia]|nr:hypothetical protein [Stenotrophomonas maltophilia]
MNAASGKHGCCADKACSDSTCMELPAGKTCRDCVHVHRCCGIFGHTPTDTHCDWFPRRYREPVATAAEGGVA